MTAHSDNGWVASSDPAALGIVRLRVTAPGIIHGTECDFPSGVRHGDVHWIFGWYLLRYHAEVERLHAGWCWGYTDSMRPNRNNPGVYSNHDSGTAIDINAPAHPNGTKGTFSTAQRKTIARLIGATHGALRAGEFYTSTTDGMHVEINTSPSGLHTAVTKMKHDYGVSLDYGVRGKVT